MPELTIIDLPSFKADPKRHGVRSENVVAIDFARKIVLIGGSYYAGEMKKSVFTTLNYYLPEKGVMPMHCSANVGPDGDTAIFFGLSGTGKTTLSADPKRTLIGDDEHGWGADGIFNFEGGCYAKCIKLSKEAEPEIYAASKRFGAVLENVVLDAQYPRAGFRRRLEDRKYPLGLSARIHSQCLAHRPRRPSENLVMLAADAFGVMPPIAKLTPAQAMYHFLSGYTAKVAGTERGLGNEPQPEFSTCFGSPFLPRDPSVYGNLLRDLIAKHDVDCWLVNTGWTGGKYGTGRRMPIKVTRALLTAALNGSLRIGRLPHRQVFRLRGADFAARRRAAYPRSDQDLGRQGRIRQDRAFAGWHVPEELRQVRSAGRRRRPRRRAGSEARSGIKFEYRFREQPKRAALTSRPFSFRHSGVVRGLPRCRRPYRRWSVRLPS